MMGRPSRHSVATFLIGVSAALAGALIALLFLAAWSGAVTIDRGPLATKNRIAAQDYIGPNVGHHPTNRAFTAPWRKKHSHVWLSYFGAAGEVGQNVQIDISGVSPVAINAWFSVANATTFGPAVIRPCSAPCFRHLHGDDSTGFHTDDETAYVRVKILPHQPYHFAVGPWPARGGVLVQSNTIPQDSIPDGKGGIVPGCNCDTARWWTGHVTE